MQPWAKLTIIIVVGRASNLGQAQTALWMRFILLLSQAAVLPGSDAGSSGVDPKSSFVIQNYWTSCSLWCLI